MSEPRETACAASPETSSDELAQVFKAISNPHRLRILRFLMTCCKPGQQCSDQQISSLCVSDIGELVNVSASTLSHHLKELNRAGLLLMQRDGQRVQCSLNTQLVNDLAKFFNM